MARIDRKSSALRRSITLLLGAALAVGIVPGGVASGAAAGKARLRRPNLVPVAPYTFVGPSTDITPDYLFGGAAIVDGCTPDEIARKGARRCLRFDTILWNKGRGPFEVAYTVDPLNGVLAAHQRIYRSNGTFKSRFATSTEYHPTHLHFHIKDVYVARLWRVDRKGRKRGRPVARSDKNGFCPEDTMARSAAPGPRRYQCFGADGYGAGGAIQVVGISPGWADWYPYQVPDQYVEIGGVRDGRYLFEMEVDPHNYFVESSETDNSVCMLIELTDGSAWVKRQRACSS